MKTSALIISPVYPSPDNRQAGIFVHRQIVNLSHLGIECRVLAYRPAPPRFPRWLARRSWLRYYWKRIGFPRLLDGVRIDQVFYQRRWEDREDVVAAIGESLIRWIESEHIEADLVYAHWLWTGGAAALRLREKFGWPVAAIARGSEMHDWQAVHPFCRSHTARVLLEADTVLTNCEDLRYRAEEIAPGSSRRIEVIYNGCDSEKFRPAEDKRAAKREAGFLPDQKVMLFCGDVISRKGISELSEAWRDFSRSRQDWHLAVVGRIVEPQLAEELRQSGGRVRFAGQVKHHQVVKYLQAADAYIQPSRLEGLANATMEAMAAGLPVISTDTCGQRELIEDGVNGWLVPTENPGALRRAMEAMAGDSEQAKRLGEAARRTIETKFNPQKEAARLADILTKTALRSAPEPEVLKG
jgi:glycosyltransferase involved in cell wall biosynthesis